MSVFVLPTTTTLATWLVLSARDAGSIRRPRSCPCPTARERSIGSFPTASAAAAPFR